MAQSGSPVPYLTASLTDATSRKLLEKTINCNRLRNDLLCPAQGGRGYLHRREPVSERQGASHQKMKSAVGLHHVKDEDWSSYADSWPGPCAWIDGSGPLSGNHQHGMTESRNNPKKERINLTEKSKLLYLRIKWHSYSLPLSRFYSAQQSL